VSSSREQTPVHTHQTTRGQIPEAPNLYAHHQQNFTLHRENQLLSLPAGSDVKIVMYCESKDAAGLNTCSNTHGCITNGKCCLQTVALKLVIDGKDVAIRTMISFKQRTVLRPMELRWDRGGMDNVLESRVP
jgi:hypothetical protein